MVKCELRDVIYIPTVQWGLFLLVSPPRVPVNWQWSALSSVIHTLCSTLSLGVWSEKYLLLPYVFTLRADHVQKRTQGGTDA